MGNSQSDTVNKDGMGFNLYKQTPEEKENKLKIKNIQKFLKDQITENDVIYTNFENKIYFVIKPDSYLKLLNIFKNNILKLDSNFQDNREKLIKEIFEYHQFFSKDEKIVLFNNNKNIRIASAGLLNRLRKKTNLKLLIDLYSDIIKYNNSIKDKNYSVIGNGIHGGKKKKKKSKKSKSNKSKKKKSKSNKSKKKY